MWFSLILVALKLAPTFARQHSLEFWDQIDFSGHGVTVINGNEGPGSLEYCTSLIRDWGDRVASVRAREDCYQVFDDFRCSGSVLYINPKSTYQSNLYSVNWNNRPKSFRLCALECDLKRPSDSNREQYDFWKYYFSVFHSELLTEFENRAKNNSSIDWSFIPSINSDEMSCQYALEWLQEELKSPSAYVGQLVLLRNKAQKVVDESVAANRDRPTANRRTATMTDQLQIIWQEVVDVIQTRLESLETADDFEDYPNYDVNLVQEQE